MNSIIIIIVGIVGAMLTFYVSEPLKQGAVRASALLSLIVGLFFYLFPDLFNPYLTKHIPIAFIGASFVGMASSNLITHYAWLVVAGSIFSLIYLNTSSFFQGYGGALGTTAFCALLVTLVGMAFLKKAR